jgi:transposase
LAEEGAKVVVTDIGEERGNEMLEEIEGNGGEGLVLGHDVSQEEQCESVVRLRQTRETFRRIVVLLNNTGIYLIKPLAETTLQPLAVRLNRRHPIRMRAYSVDLRRKIVEAVQWGMSQAEAARTFGVGTSSVKRYVNMAQDAEGLVPKTAPGKKHQLDWGATKVLQEDLRRRPEATHRQRARLLFELLGVRVSEASACRAVKPTQLCPKKDQWVPANATSG